MVYYLIIHLLFIDWLAVIDLLLFYFTTGLHGFHVIIGTLLFFLILFFIQIEASITKNTSQESTNGINANNNSFHNNIDVNLINANNGHINSLYFMEYSFPLFLSSYYWHFVDWIWFCVFLIFIYAFNNSISSFLHIIFISFINFCFLITLCFSKLRLNAIYSKVNAVNNLNYLVYLVDQ